MKPPMSFIKWFSLTLLIFPVFCNRQNITDVNAADEGGLTLPHGFSSMVVADNLGEGRHIAIRSNGDVYLALRSLRNGKGIVALRDLNGDKKADTVAYFAGTPTTGMEMSGDYLYYSNFTEVYRVKPGPGELVPNANAPELIAGGFPVQNQHNDKTFTLDGSGNIYVNVGAPTNSCTSPDRTPGTPGMDPCPQLERQAGIWRFRSDKTGQDQVKDGYHYASGIRNSIALDWNHSNNTLYVVQHGRDQLYQLYPAMYSEKEGADLPAEEFFMVKDGGFYGWPYCYYDQFKKKKVLAPEYGGDKNTTGRCAGAEDPVMAFPGHLAPNDLLFYTGTMFPEKYRNGAFIAFHGSWNRAPLPQEGYFVAFVPFSGSLPSGDMEVFADRFAGTGEIISPGDAKYRPMGLALAPDGSLYVSDSNKGRIWRISYTGN